MNNVTQIGMGKDIAVLYIIGPKNVFTAESIGDDRIPMLAAALDLKGYDAGSDAPPGLYLGGSNGKMYSFVEIMMGVLSDKKV